MSAIGMTITSLLARYRANELTPRGLIDTLLANADARGKDAAWITRLSREQLEPYLERLDSADPAALRHPVRDQGQHRSRRCADHGGQSRLCLYAQ